MLRIFADSMTPFEKAFSEVSDLVKEFEANSDYYLSPKYQESEVREDFLNKFWTALGWDVRHITQTNPREQEVKVEKNPDPSGRKADYAFYLKPDYKNPQFFVEAKKPSQDLDNPGYYFQIVRYGYNAGTPVGVLTDFAEFHVIDCRYEPNINKSFPSAQIRKFGYKEYLDRENFGYIYWLFSREAIEAGKLKEFASELPKAKGKGAKKLTSEEARPVDEAFLTKLEEYRLTLARAFKKADESLSSEDLTEATQKVIDRLVFIRFLEDKNIESDYIVDQIAASGAAKVSGADSQSASGAAKVSGTDSQSARGTSSTRGLRVRATAWQSFINWSKELDVKYNGIVFKKNTIDEPGFKAPDDKVFAELCRDISHLHSKYLFSYIPIEILGSIYERFLGNVIRATAKRADIEEKPEVRKAGGVYYTPQYIVDYIVSNTVGKILQGISDSGADSQSASTESSPGGLRVRATDSKSLAPKEISKLRFADIACGSGSFLIAVYDKILHHVESWYNSHPDEAKKAGCIEIDKGIYALSLKQKQKILTDNIYGVDIDHQAVEVAQLSLFLKLLESESGATAGQLSFEKTKILPDLTNNIICGNSLVEYDIADLFPLTPEDEARIKPFSFQQAFKSVMASGGFDAIVGNPPWGAEFDENIRKYLVKGYKEVPSKTKDSYMYFVCKAINLLKGKALLGYITPNTWLLINNAAHYRRYILGLDIDEISDFGDGVFQDATVESCILILEKSKSTTTCLAKRYRKGNLISSHTIEKEIWTNDPDSRILVDLTSDLSKIISKIKSISDEFGNSCTIIWGIKPYQVGYGEPPQTKDILEKRIFHSSSPKGKEWKPLVVGSNINRYTVEFPGDQYIKYGKWLMYPSNEELILKPKILLRQTSDILRAGYDDKGLYPQNSVFILSSEKYNLKLLLGLLNSSLFGLFYKVYNPQTGKVFAEIKPSIIKQLPIKILDLTNPADKSRHDALVRLVDQMLETKKRLAWAKTGSEREQIERKCDYLDGEIDKIVYGLYGLTEEEIAVVEGDG